MKDEDAEMIPESSSEAQGKMMTPAVSSMEAESSSVTSVEPSSQVLYATGKPPCIVQ